jgi:hypothetical protein
MSPDAWGTASRFNLTQSGGELQLLGPLPASDGSSDATKHYVRVDPAWSSACTTSVIMHSLASEPLPSAQAGRAIRPLEVRTVANPTV